MRSRIAIALSVVGVLSSGSAAVVFNTQAMKPKHVASSTAVEPKMPDMATLAPPTTPPTDSAAPTDNAPETASNAPAASTTTTSVATTTTTRPTTTTTTTTRPPTTTTSAPTTTTKPPSSNATSSSMYRFVVPGSGTVILDTSGGQLTVVETTPTPGWRIDSAVSTSTKRITVVFVSDTLATTFTAELGSEAIFTYVETKNR